MTDLEEHDLYLTDPVAWADYVAPRRAQMLAAENDPERKRELWRSFGQVSRDAITRLAEPSRRAA